MQIVLNPQRVRLSNLCPWAASWVGCREELQQGKVADSRLLALLWSLALPAGTHLQLNRPDWLTDCLATLTVLNTTCWESIAVVAFVFNSPSHWMTPFEWFLTDFLRGWSFFLWKNRASSNQITHNMTPMYLMPVMGVCFRSGIASGLPQDSLIFRTYVFFPHPEFTVEFLQWSYCCQVNIPIIFCYSPWSGPENCPH